MSKYFVGKNGTVIISDAERESLPIIKKLCPDFQIKTLPPRHGFVPNLQKNRDRIQANVKKAEAILRKCTLCGLSCKADRDKKKGPCGLGCDAIHQDPFENIGLEIPINPSISLGFLGCGLRCCTCGWQERLEVVNDGSSRKLENTLWDEIRRFKEANSMEFVGGDPVCSVPGILRFLSAVPADFNLPVVWDDAMYGRPETYDLLKGAIDVYVPDFKFSPECSSRLSDAPNYWDVATAALEVLMGQNVRIIVRILVLGKSHFQCCHKRILEYLRSYRNRIFISVLDQYFPANEAFRHSELDRLPTQEEIDEVRNLVEKYGLRDVNNHPEKFWDD